MAEPDHAEHKSRAVLMWIGTAVIVSLLALTMLRTFQQAPPAASWNEVYQTRPTVVAVPVQGESVRLVQPGETLWSIAAEVAPGSDRRETVQRLIERNGGASLLAGQTVVIPAAVGNP